jgi:hypothetical protein
VPEKFDFLRDNNQYGLNTTTKFLLEQKGFAAYVANEQLPTALAVNKCIALKAEVVQKKGLFVTNLTLLLKDCQGNIVFKSKEGKSREKEYQVAYEEALKNAFLSLNDEPYKYDSTLVAQPQMMSQVPQAVPAASSPGSGAGSAASTATGSAPAPAPASAPAKSAPVEITGTLYAQVTTNGYQLIDTSPKKILTLLKTSMQDYFIAEAGSSNGVVFKKDGDWFFEYYRDSKLVSQKLEIKF